MFFNLFFSKLNFDRFFFKKAFRIAFPVFFQNILTTVLIASDGAMVSFFFSHQNGAFAVAAIGMVLSTFFPFMLILMGLGSGVSIFISQYWGNNQNKTEIRYYLAIGCIASLLINLIYVIISLRFGSSIIGIFMKETNTTVLNLAVSYLNILVIGIPFRGLSFILGFGYRSINQSFFPMMVNIIVVILNILLNYIFIFGHFFISPMGIQGAALASVISQILEYGILISFYNNPKYDALKIGWKELLGLGMYRIKRFIKTIIPILVEEIFWSISVLAQMIFFSRMGIEVAAAYQILGYFINFGFAFVLALTQAAAVNIGHIIGELKSYLQVKEEALRYIVFSGILGFIVSGIIIGFSKLVILYFFQVEESVQHLAHDAIIAFFALFFIKTIATMLPLGILRAGADTRFPMIVESILSLCVVFTVILFVQYSGLSMPKIQFCVGLFEIFRGCIYYIRLQKNQWMKVVT